MLYILIALLLWPAWGCGDSIRFGSRDSSLKLTNGSKLRITTPINNTGGRIIQESGGEVVGSDMIFDKGFLEVGGSEVRLTGTYQVAEDLANTFTIRLDGDAAKPNELRVSAGTNVDYLYVKGTYNKVAGFPSFGNPIQFTDVNTTLTFAMLSALDNHVNLNGGTMILEEDLKFADGSKIEGVGKVILNENTLTFGGEALTFNNYIYWDHANDVALSGKVNLGETWNFVGDSTINGHGNILDLSSGGTIFVGPNTNLYLTDLVIKGLGDGFIEFADRTSNIYMSEVNVELAKTYTTTTGGIHVEGPSTFILSDKDWHFDIDGSLTVDGVVLWTDRRGTPTVNRGFITFDDPKNNYFASLNSGTIKEKVYLSDVDNLQDVINMLDARLDIAEVNIENNSYAIATHEVEITNNSNAIVKTWDLTLDNSHAIVAISRLDIPEFVGTWTSDLYFDESAHVDPNEQIIIAGDLLFSGSGSMIVFSNPNAPQFIVQPGKTVTLEKVNLQNVNQNTFQLGVGSKVVIGSQVTFGLTEDVVFNTAQFECSCEDGDFNLYGVGGLRQVGFSYKGSTGGTTLGRAHRRDNEPSRAFNLRNRTMSLKNIELRDIKEIGNYSNGTIQLLGGSKVNFYESSDHRFFIEGVNNVFQMAKHGIKLSGKLLYGTKARNSVRIVHSVDGAVTINPHMTFGDGFAYVSSTDGVAELLFDDDEIIVENGGYNAFVVGDNAYIGGKKLAIWTYPIRQISTNVEYADSLILSTNLSSATESASGFYEAPRQVLPEEEFTPGLIGYHVDPDGSVRPLIIRAHPQQEYQEYESDRIALIDAHGEIVLKDTVVTDLSIDTTKPLTLVLNGGSTVYIRDAVTLKKGDTIIVSGDSNILRIQDTCCIEGGFMFEDDAELIVEFDKLQDKQPALYLAPYITFNPDVKIKLVGDGIVQWLEE